MKVGFVGIGAMGMLMAEHVAKAGYETYVNDLDTIAMKEAGKKGLKPIKTLPELRGLCDVIIIVAGFDHQVLDITRELAAAQGNDCVLVVASTVHPETVVECQHFGEPVSISVVDAPVCFGLEGAREGSLMSLVGGSSDAVEKVRAVLGCYSREVAHLGKLGCGEVGKSVNNLLHWVHCVSNFEAILLAKVSGIDAQKMREILLRCPAKNGTLERWDNTRFTWHEKDMDIVMDWAQSHKLPLPLAGHVDQLVKRLGPDDVAKLLYQDEVDYLGQRFKESEAK